eukprot:2544473-Prymnesium_polylepis.2
MRRARDAAWRRGGGARLHMVAPPINRSGICTSPRASRHQLRSKLHALTPRMPLPNQTTGPRAASALR